MSRDAILKDEDGERYSYDKFATQKWLEGQPAGADKAAHWLEELAVEHFRAGRDAEAKLLREVAAKLRQTLVPTLKKEATEHERKYPYQLGPEDEEESA